MNGKFNQSVKDIIPAYHGNVPPKLLKYIESVYQLSLREKPSIGSRNEIARYHICTYLAIERFQDNFDLPSPEITKIPLPPKTAGRLIDEFRDNVVIKSASNTPNSSPRKSQYSTPTSSPVKMTTLKTQNTPKLSSPLKRLQQLSDSTPKRQKKSDFNDEESPFNPKKPTKKADSPTKSSPTKYVYDRKHVSITDLITFANNFYIPAKFTPAIIETFLAHKHKFVKKSEWMLACGLVHSAYIRVNHKLINSTMGLKSQLMNQLFQYQKGGLMQWNLQLWCNIVESWVKDEGWVHDIEQEYMYGSKSWDLKSTEEYHARVGKDWSLLQKFGAMITGDVLVELKSQDAYYKTWKARVMNQIENACDVQKI